MMCCTLVFVLFCFKETVFRKAILNDLGECRVSGKKILLFIEIALKQLENRLVMKITEKYKIVLTNTGESSIPEFDVGKKLENFRQLKLSKS